MCVCVCAYLLACEQDVCTRRRCCHSTRRALDSVDSRCTLAGRRSCVHMRARDGFSYQFTGGLYGQLPQLYFSMNILASRKQKAFPRLPHILVQTERAERSRGCASTASPSADIIGGNYRRFRRRRLKDRTRVVKRPIRFPLTTFK